MLYLTELLIEHEVMQLDIPECLDEVYLRIGQAATHLAEIEPTYEHFVFVRVGDV